MRWKSLFSLPPFLYLLFVPLTLLFLPPFSIFCLSLLLSFFSPHFSIFVCPSEFPFSNPFSFSLSVYLKVGHSRPPFLHFRFFNCYVKTTMFSIKLLMAGFKLVSNCVGSNCFAIFATTSWANASLRLPLLRAPWPKCLFPNCHQAVLYFSLNVWSHFDRFQIPANFENGHWTVKGISTSNLF